MSDLKQRLKHLRNRSRQALWLHGASWVIVALLGSAFFAGFADWSLHLDNNRLRFAFGLMILVAAVVLAWRTLIRPLQRTLSDVALAIKIEQRFPGFQDSLSSTVQFEETAEDARLGSPNLQRHVVQETLTKLQRVNLDDVIETRPVRRAVIMAIVVCLLVTAVIGLRPADASLALKRLVFPFASQQEWPRKTELCLLTADFEPILTTTGEPFRRVQGEMFKFYVENRKGTLPKDVSLQLRYGDGDLETEQLRRVTVRDNTGTVHTFCVANFVVERGPVLFRVVGGDDETMPFQTLNVVPPPHLRQLNVTLEPPKYSGREEQRLPDGVGHFEALVGTRVRITAVANKPLKSAALRVKNNVVSGLKLSRDGLRFTAEFIVRDSGNYSYGFELIDRENFENPNAPRYDVRALTDRVPVVRLESPTDDLRATANALIPVKYTVEDDLQVRTVVLMYRSVADPKSKHQTISLYQRPKARAPKPRENRDTETPTVRDSYLWTLDAQVGTQLRYFIQADDDFDLDTQGNQDPSGVSKHVGRSLTKTITIVTPAEKAAEISGRYGELLEDLGRVERLQRQARDQLGQLQVQLDKAGRLRPREDVNLLRLVSRSQRDIVLQLVDSNDAIQKRAVRLIAEMNSNHLPGAALKRRLERIIGELEALKQTAFKPIERNLRDVEIAVDGGTGTPPADPRKPPQSAAEQSGRLKEVANNQEEVLTSLRELIGELSEWRNWHDLAGELKDLIRNQQEIGGEAGRLKNRTLGKPFSELPPQDQADLAKLAERQRRLSDRMKQFQQSVERFLSELRKDVSSNRNPLETLNDAAGLIRDRNIIDRMATASQRMESNQLGETVADQTKLVENLRELESILENRGTEDLETLIKRQKAAEQELETLQKQQNELTDQLRKLGDKPENQAKRDELQRLIKQQDQLRRKASELARKLRRLSANDANTATQRAAESMERTLETMRRGSLEQSRLQQRETLDRIEQARRQLARTRARNESLMARQILEQLADDLRGIVRRQDNVIAGTTRLQTEYERTQSWSRGRLITLDSLRDEQARLQSRVTELAKSMQSTAVFSLALQSIVSSMQDAARSLNEARDDAARFESAGKAQQLAKKQLETLIRTLTPENGQPKTQSMTSGDGGEMAAADLAGPSRLAQLKLLKSLQEDIRSQTEQFDRTRKNTGKLTANLQAELDRLAARQEKLSDLTRNLMRELGIPDDKSLENQSDSKGSAIDLLRRITRNMRLVGSLLGKSETGTATQKTQSNIIDDLAELIRNAPRKTEPKSSAPQPSPKQRTGNKASKIDGNSKTKKNGSDSGKASNKESKKKASDSENTVRDPSKVSEKVRIARQQKLIQEVWGHLPEAVRQQLRNVSEEKYLPKYKPLISRYFESLAE